MHLEPIGFALASLALATPIFAVVRPALEDFPQHVAITSLLRHYDDPEMGFARDHVIDWGRSPHVLWYALSTTLAYLLGPVLAAKSVLAASLVSLPLAFRFMVERAERPVVLSWLALGLAWNGFVAYGFAQFVAGVTPMLISLGLAARPAPLSRRAQGALALALVVTFGMHLLCAALAFVGVIALRVCRDGTRAWRSCIGVGLASATCLLWLAGTEAGRDVFGMAGLGAERNLAAPDWPAAAEILPEATQWLSNVTHGGADDRLFLGWISVLVFAALAGESGGGRLRAAWLVTVAVAWAGAALLPTTVGWIWPLNVRFAWLALLLGLVLLPVPRGMTRTVWLAACGALALGRVALVADALTDVASVEQAGLSRAVSGIPIGSRVCGVMHDSHSSRLPFWPHHYAAGWVQAERGGSLVFSFVEHPSTPVRWREGTSRPRTGPTGFRPERVDPAVLGWCERVLVLNGPGAFEHSTHFERVVEAGAWSVWAPVARPADP